MVGRRWGEEQESGFGIQDSGDKQSRQGNAELSIELSTADCLLPSKSRRFGERDLRYLSYCLPRTAGPNKVCRWPGRGVK